jgi:hypothetical protein
LGSINLTEMDEIKKQVKEKYDTNIVKSWTNFTILFQIYNSDKKQKIKDELHKIHLAIQQFDELIEIDFVIDEVINGFGWNQNFGNSECWIAVYEKGHTNHQTSPQLYLSINESRVQYGLTYGAQHPEKGRNDLDVLYDIEQFTFNRI